MIKAEIVNLVRKFVAEKNAKALWRMPVLGFANAGDPLFEELKRVVTPDHLMPRHILKDAKTVVAFFVPFDEKVIESNYDEDTASRLWAYSYNITNDLLAEISEMLKIFLNQLGFDVAIIPPTHNFDEKKLLSRWSHRHAGYIAGIGRFGLNNMLITEAGCAGRISTLVTNAEIEPDKRLEDEYCLYYYNRSCNICADRCVNGALSVSGFNRFLCYAQCLKNGRLYEDLGFPSVCGKCVVELPCTCRIPL